MFCLYFNDNITNMEQEEFVEQEKPSFKEMLIGYKDKKVGPIVKHFNRLYIFTTLAAYIYYVIYASIHITKNGLENPMSILMLVAVVLYTGILVGSIAVSSSFKSAKKRFKRSMKPFKIFKRSLTIANAVIAVVALISAFKSETLSTTTIVVSILSLILNLIKIWFSLFMIGLSAGTSALKFGAKQTYKYVKKKYQQKNTAPEIESDAVNDQIEFKD